LSEDGGERKGDEEAEHKVNEIASLDV